mgnify:CR=1 FL=1
MALGQGLVAAAPLGGNPPPLYPAAALGTAVAGDVVFIARLTEEGAVTSVTVTEVPQQGVGFEESVTDAVMRWRFSPATNDGIAIPTTYVGRINFTPEWPTAHARMYARTSETVWQTAQSIVESLGRMEQRTAADGQLLVTQWTRYEDVGIPTPDPAEPGGPVPDEFQLHLFVSPFVEPARVHVGSVSLGPDTIRYNTGDAETWFFRQLEERLEETGRTIPIPATPHRAAAADILLRPDPCLNEPPANAAPASAPTLLLAVPALFHDLPPGAETVLTLEVTVALDGAISSSRVLGARGGEVSPGMVDAALGAVSLWRYQPSRRRRCTLPFTGQVSMAFRGPETTGAPSAFTEQIYEPGPGIENPQVLEMVQARYTPEAQRREIEGRVLVSAVVLPDGTVGDVQVVESLDASYGLDRAAVDAARRWRFTPGSREGQPVAVRVIIELAFALQVDR